MDKTKFSRRLTMLREEQDLTQGELAEKVGVSRSAIGMYEQGRRAPDFDALDALADYFGVGLPYMTGASNERGSYPRHDDDPAPDVAAVAAAYVRAPEKTKLMVRMLLGIEEGH